MVYERFNSKFLSINHRNRVGNFPLITESKVIETIKIEGKNYELCVREYPMEKGDCIYTVTITGYLDPFWVINSQVLNFGATVFTARRYWRIFDVIRGRNIGTDSNGGIMDASGSFDDFRDALKLISNKLVMNLEYELEGDDGSIENPDSWLRGCAEHDEDVYMWDEDDDYDDYDVAMEKE